MNLLEELASLLQVKAKIRCQAPIELPNFSEPEPDFVIAIIREDNYLTTHPQPEDIFLVIEIADSSLGFDRDVKLTLYAEAGIENFWIFNLIDDRLETYTQLCQIPTGKFEYCHTLIFLPNETVEVPSFAEGNLNLSNIFPPQIA